MRYAENNTVIDSEWLIVEFSRRCLKEGIFPNKDRVEAELRRNGLSLLRPELHRAYHQSIVEILDGTMRCADNIESADRSS